MISSFPSPSKSAYAMVWEFELTPIGVGMTKEEAANPPPPKVVKNTRDAYAVRPPTVTVTGPNVAFPGAVTKMESANETDGVPNAVPKRTTVLAGVGEKFEPRMVTRVGNPPLSGEKDVMVGI